MKYLLLLSSFLMVALLNTSCFFVDEPDPPSPEPTPTYLKACGAPVVPCGCHGFIGEGELLYSSECASGYEVAVMCYGYYCPRGGYQWRTRCAC